MSFGDTARLDSMTDPRLQVEVAIPDGPAPVILVAVTTNVYRVLEITDLLDAFGIRP